MDEFLSEFILSKIISTPSLKPLHSFDLPLPCCAARILGLNIKTVLQNRTANAAFYLATSEPLTHSLHVSSYFNISLSISLPALSFPVCGVTLHRLNDETKALFSNGSEK